MCALFSTSCCTLLTQRPCCPPTRRLHERHTSHSVSAAKCILTSAACLQHQAQAVVPLAQDRNRHARSMQADFRSGCLQKQGVPYWDRVENATKIGLGSGALIGAVRGSWEVRTQLAVVNACIAQSPTEAESLATGALS